MLIETCALKFCLLFPNSLLACSKRDKHISSGLNSHIRRLKFKPLKNTRSGDS